MAFGSKQESRRRHEALWPQPVPEWERARRQLIQLVYGLQAAALLVVVTAVVGVVINYVTLPRVRGTWLEAHARYQISTFWGAVLWVFAGMATFYFWVGVLVLLAGVVWYIYRVVIGWLGFQEGRLPYGRL